MAAPKQNAGEFENWLNGRLDALEVDREVYGSYILGVLQEEETDEEKLDALQGILAAFLEEDSLEEVCRQILDEWTAFCGRSAALGNRGDAEVQALASLIEKQAQIVVKQKEVSEEARRRKEAMLAQYANVTDDDEDDGEDQTTAGIPAEKSLFKNTNVEEVLNRRKQQRDQAKEEAQKKKEQDKVQREKDKMAKQERKDKEKKRTQKGERKR